MIGLLPVLVGRREQRSTDDEYRQLGKSLSMAHQGDVWKPAIQVTWLMNPDGVATRQGAETCNGPRPTYHDSRLGWLTSSRSWPARQSRHRREPAIWPSPLDQVSDRSPAILRCG
jgi:hypothetical protein